MTSLTPYSDVNAVLHDFKERIQAILGGQFIGMYVYGSLAIGDFDPDGSDIDFAVVTDGDIDDERFVALDTMHRQFAESGSRWAEKIEAAYLPRGALNHSAPTSARYPQLEKGRGFAREPLEIGWPFQRHTLREYAVIVSGPDPRTLIDPVPLEDMRRAAVAIIAGWLDQAHHDPDWLTWVRHREAQAFVVLTLCRILAVLGSGEIASKPAAAHWAQTMLGPRWTALIERALAGQHIEGNAPDSDVDDTISLIEYVLSEIS